MQGILERVACRLLPRVLPGRVLAARERRTLAEVASVVLEGAPLDVTPEQTAENVEAFLIAGRSRRAWRVRVLLTIIELSPLPTHARRFSALTRDQRRQLLRERWTTGRHLWRVCAKVRNLVILGAYGDPRAGDHTGYVPVPLRTRFKDRRPPAQDLEVA